MAIDKSSPPMPEALSEDERHQQVFDAAMKSIVTGPASGVGPSRRDLPTIDDPAVTKSFSLSEVRAKYQGDMGKFYEGLSLEQKIMFADPLFPFDGTDENGRPHVLGILAESLMEANRRHAANLDRFEKSLTPEQKKQWDGLKADSGWAGKHFARPDDGIIPAPHAPYEAFKEEVWPAAPARYIYPSPEVTVPGPPVTPDLKHPEFLKTPVQPKTEPARNFELEAHKGPGAIPFNADVLKAQELMKEMKGLLGDKLPGVNLGHFKNHSGTGADGLDGKFGKMTQDSIMAIERFLDPNAKPTGVLTDGLKARMKEKLAELKPSSGPGMEKTVTSAPEHGGPGVPIFGSGPFRPDTLEFGIARMESQLQLLQSLGQEMPGMRQALDMVKKIEATPGGLAAIERLGKNGYEGLSRQDKGLLMEAMGGEAGMQKFTDDMLKSVLGLHDGRQPSSTGPGIVPPPRQQPSSPDPGMVVPPGKQLLKEPAQVAKVESPKAQPPIEAKTDTPKIRSADDAFDTLDKAEEKSRKEAAERPALAESAKQEMLASMKQSGVSDLVRHRASTAYDHAVKDGQLIENLQGIARAMGGGNSELRQTLANHEAKDVAVVQGSEQKARQMLADSGMDVARALIENGPGVAANPLADSGLAAVGPAVSNNSKFTV